MFFGRVPLQVALTLIWPAGIAALVYAVLAAGSARDDLGALSGRRNRPASSGESGGVTVGGGEPLAGDDLGGDHGQPCHAGVGHRVEHRWATSS